MLEETACAAVEKKGNSDVTGLCLVHMKDQMWQEGVDVPFYQPLFVGFCANSFGEIVSSLGNDVSYAATRVGHVAGISWDHMKMKMGDGLPSGRSKIETNIESGG